MPAPRSAATPRSLYRWTRDLHLYAGLFASPVVVIYALSVIVLNHAYLPWGGAPPAPADTVRITVPNAENSLEVARAVQRQIGVRGEIDFIGRKPGAPKLGFPIRTPGHTAQVRVDLEAGTAIVERGSSGIWDAMVYLHTMPGPHNQSVRGNWAFTRAWGWVADATVYLLLFLTASGIYLWTALRAQRRTGLLFLGAGALVFAALVAAIVA